MQLSAATIRWLALASIPGGLLLVLSWAIPAVSLLPNISAPDVRTVAGPTADLALLSTWFTLGFALLFSVVVLAIAKAARVSWVGASGAVLYATGAFFLGVQAIFASVSPATILPWHFLFIPTLFSLGAVLFGVAAFRSGALPRGAALLLAFIQPTALFGVAGPQAGMALFGTDFGLAGSTLLRMYGYVGMFGVAAAWMWLGYAAWKRDAAEASRVPIGSGLIAREPTGTQGAV
jgi:hypothetical protein